MNDLAPLFADVAAVRERAAHVRTEIAELDRRIACMRAGVAPTGELPPAPRGRDLQGDPAYTRPHAEAERALQALGARQPQTRRAP